MSGTANPSVSFTFGDGNSPSLPDTGDEAILIVGPASGGPLNRPRRVGSLAAVLAFFHGPMVAQASHHVTYSRPCYVMRCAASTAGTNGAVTKVPSAASPGTLAVSATIQSLHLQFVNNGTAMNLSTGFALPYAPLPLAITLGAGGHNTTNFTVTYINEGNIQTSEVVAAAGAGTYSTVGNVAKIISVVSDVDPTGTVDFNMTFPGPMDRYDVMINVTRGGQLSGGAVQPQVQFSMDNGQTFGPTLTVPATGILDLFSYAGGLTPQATGMRMTLSSSAAAATEIGSLRVLGADVNGDLLFTGLKTTSTITVVVGGVGTPLSITLAGDAVTINAQTDGGGLCLTTANALITFWNSNDAGATAARQRFRLRGAIGTGASLLAAHGAANLNNTNITWTATQEGVGLTVLEAGSNTGLSVVVAGKAVTINLATDANGARTSTATAVVAAVAGSAAAAALLAGVASGSGAGLAGDTVGALALPVQFNTGDVFTWSTTPPVSTNADLTAAFLALQTKRETLASISGIVVAKDGVDVIDTDLLANTIDQIRAKQDIALFGVMSGAYMGTTAEATWIANEIAKYTNKYTTISLCEGEIDTKIPAYGTMSRRNVRTAYCARLMKCPLSVFPSAVKCPTLDGTEFSLPGVGNHTVAGSDPNFPEYASLYQSDDGLIQLHANNMVTARTWPSFAGVFIRQSVQFVNDGDDWVFLPHRRVANKAADVAYFATAPIANADLLSDPKTGKLAELEHQAIENHTTQALLAALLDDNGVRHITALQVVSDREIIFNQTYTIHLTVQIVMKNPAITITIEIDRVATLAQTNATAA